MAASLDRAEGLRRRLVADVAHELRNPIAALRAQIEGVAEGVLEPDAARLASLAEDARYLTRLVEDLQELSAADAGRLRYDMHALDLAELARREGERLGERHRGAVEVLCETGGPSGSWVTRDGSRRCSATCWITRFGTRSEARW